MSFARALAERLERLYAPAVLDVLEERGLRNQALAPGLQPTDPAARVAGPAFPYRFVPAELWSRDDVIPDILRVYEAAPAASVLVAHAGAEPPYAAHFGELSAETCKARGIRGAIIHGGLRDGPYVGATGFPVWFRYRTPVDVVGRYRIDAVGEPVNVGGVVIAAGDFVIADLDGVVVIPGDLAEEIVTAAEVCARQEDEIRRRLGAQEAASDLYREAGRF